MISRSQWVRVTLAVALILPLGTGTVGAHPDTFAPLVKAQRNKIVHIQTKNDDAQERPRELFGPFRSPEYYRGMGSGFVIAPDGLIVTNYHVIEDAEVIEVVLHDDSVFLAELIGQDERTDLALLRIQVKDLPTVIFGDSNRLEVGDWVVAIGNPLGLDHSVTAGIVSAKGRNIFDSENVAYGEFIQTDAAINPGNSGGPLFNMDGEVIGVNTAVSSRGQGIGFAVPSNLVVGIIEQLRTHGRVIRGWLGVVIQAVDADWLSSMGLPREMRGILINDIVPNAPAARSTLRKGDLIVSYADQPLLKVPQLQKLVAFTAPGSTVTIGVMRRENEQAVWQNVKLDIKIGFEPGELLLSEQGQDLLGKLDIGVSSLTQSTRNRLGLGDGPGLEVDRVGAGGLGGRIGLEAGDIILEVARQEVGSAEDLVRVLRDAASNLISIVVQRDTRTLYLTLSGAEIQ